jgi:transposase InsO family protein
MRADFLPFRVLLLAVSGWVHREQQAVIEYLVEENRVLREQIGNRRLRLTDEQRRRLAAKGIRLGRQVLERIASIVTPDTILRWHRQLIAAKWTFSKKHAGRPGIMNTIRRLILRMARENPRWGYCRIQGALKNLDHTVAKSTVRNVLREHGILSAPQRPTSWRGFLKAHWGQMVATDFFTVEAWTGRGLSTLYVLFFLDLTTRRVHIAGMTRNPDARFMVEAVRASHSFLQGKRFLICDRDTKFSQNFKAALPAGLRIVQTPFQAPNANAFAERFVRSIKEECLSRMIWFGEVQVRKALFEYQEHYHKERNHQGIGNELIEEPPTTQSGTGVDCCERLGGLLRHYERAAA